MPGSSAVKTTAPPDVAAAGVAADAGCRSAASAARSAFSCSTSEGNSTAGAKNVRAKAAMAVEHCFSGQGLGETWDDGHRRGAFVGGFSCYSK